MPYPEDPFALRLNSGLLCPTDGCGKRLMRETKDQSSPYMGQLKCDECGFTSDDVNEFRSQAKQDKIVLI
jgi:C4-type Zn-finger protein